MSDTLFLAVFHGVEEGDTSVLARANALCSPRIGISSFLGGGAHTISNVFTTSTPLQTFSIYRVESVIMSCDLDRTHVPGQMKVVTGVDSGTCCRKQYGSFLYRPSNISRHDLAAVVVRGFPLLLLYILESQSQSQIQ